MKVWAQQEFGIKEKTYPHLPLSPPALICYIYENPFMKTKSKPAKLYTNEAMTSLRIGIGEGVDLLLERGYCKTMSKF